jgi:hypothetical protein
MRTDAIPCAPVTGARRPESRLPAQALQTRVHHAARPAAGAGTAFDLFELTGRDRVLAEQFISRRFAESFRARIEAFMPRLFAMYDANDHLCGALGLRSARHRLFVEHYLDQPIEQAIARRTGACVERASIVEAGHLSGAFPGAMRTMIWLLTERLQRENFQWVAFTGTTALRNAFRRNGLFPLDIGRAAADRLPHEARAAWGSYYDHCPRVFVGRIQDGVQRMMQVAAQAQAGVSA